MIKTAGLSFWYTGESQPALRDVSIQFDEGEVILLAGPNGGGKSTLLKAFLGVIPTIIPGTLKGRILINNQPVNELTTSQLAGNIGIVLQDPESQISNLIVNDELNFGPANLCWTPSDIAESVDSAARQMEISHLRPVSVLALSGGQLQRLAIASLLAMRPEVLILDEPVTNLDPLGVASVVNAIRLLKCRVKLIIISSHWLDPFLCLATRLVILNKGEVMVDAPLEALEANAEQLTKFGVRIPQLWQLSHRLAQQGFSLDSHTSEWQLTPRISQSSAHPLNLALDRVSFHYERGGSRPLSNISLSVGLGERLALVGHNGQGKTTLARLMAGLLKPTSGRILQKADRVGMVLQKPSLGFICNTVREEISYGNSKSPNEVTTILDQFELGKYHNRSPFNLSGGEQRRLALATALLNNPTLLLLDESTAGLDALQVATFLTLLHDFAGTVIHITHDARIVGQEVETVAAIDHGEVIFRGHPAQMTKIIIRYLGFDQVSATIKFASEWLEVGIPMLPEQVEVRHVGL